MGFESLRRHPDSGIFLLRKESVNGWSWSSASERSRSRCARVTAPSRASVAWRNWRRSSAPGRASTRRSSTATAAFSRPSSASPPRTRARPPRSRRAPFLRRRILTKADYSLAGPTAVDASDKAPVPLRALCVPKT